ncbi:MAG: ribokinase [Planctomycetes bacterium]|nr:ribokinase [Planctomycetota bacterium]
MSVIVIGSANTDLTVTAERLPEPGETVLGGDYVVAGGGKGANQAVAAARAGGCVTFVGRVGDDEFGRLTRRRLQTEGINTDLLRTDEHCPTGVALIIVDSAGENLIAVSPGANARVCPRDVEAARESIRTADLLLLQLEVPVETVSAAVDVAWEEGVPVLLNPAPAAGPGLRPELLRRVEYLAPNAGEALRLAGAAPGLAPEKLADRIRTMGVQTVILTLGESGACICDQDGPRTLGAPSVEPVDTVGAGDCFCGVLAVALGEGRPLDEAVLVANCAAALSVQRKGAQPSLPHREEIEQMLREYQSDSE